MTDRTRRVVLLIDYDNLQICAARDTPGRDLQLTPVVQLAQRYGTVILARAYAEWNLSTERLAVYKAGIEPAFAPVLRTESDRSGKSLADTVMVAEGMDMLWTLSPEVVVLATSDKDLIPLVRVAKQRGAFVVVLGSDFTAIPLREMADEHVTYRQLITEVGGRGATEAGPGRQPAALPEPSRRRRDRTGRERPAAPAPSGVPAGQSRPERESAPTTPATPTTPTTPTTAAAPAAATAAAPPGAEPVAPVASSAPGESDMQTSSRRRRRRGSRRRSDRLGLNAETSPTPEGVDAAQDETEFDETVAEAIENGVATEEITPTTSAVDVARASDATVEPEAAEEAPEPQERRRRTRRRAPVETARETEGGPEITQAASEAVAPPQSADVLPPPPPEAASTNGPTSAAPEEPTAKPARARRVASASRGRTRRP